MNFQTMDYFIMLAREKSFTKAAEKLYITQQSLSAQIAQLEKELGTKLFLRHVPLELTYGGEVFLKYAVDFQQNYLSLQRDFSDIAQQQKGLLRIGIAYVRGRTILPPIIERFNQGFPGITIRLRETSNENLPVVLGNGEVDIIIGSFNEGDPEIELHDFYQEKIVLLLAHQLFTNIYGAKAKKIEAEFKAGKFTQLSTVPFVLSGPNNIAGRLGRYILNRENILPEVLAQSDNLETLLALCTHGVGACFSPKNLIKAVLSKDQVKSMKIFDLGPDASYTIRFGIQKKKQHWSVLSEFINIAKEVVQNKF